MRLLHTSDWHLGMPAGPGSCQEDQRFFLSQLYEIIRRERVEAALRRRFSAKLDILSTISGALETCRDHLDSLPDLKGPEDLEARRAELDSWICRVRDREQALRTQSPAVYHRSLRILRAHPSASAKDFQEAMDDLRRLGRKS